LKPLLLSEVFPPQTGGSGRWFWEVYRRLPREEVCVVAGEYAGCVAFDAGHDVPVTRMPLTMPNWGLRSLKALRQYWRLFRQLKGLVRREGIEAVHAGRVLPEGWLAWMLRKWCGLPYVVYVHGEELTYGDHSRELAWMMRRVFGRAERVIVNSRNTARMMQEHWNLSDETVSVVHPGVDTQRFVPVESDSVVREKLGWTGRRVVLTVGRLQKRKGHDMLIRALPRIRETVPDVLYAVMGDGDERDRLKQLARETGVEEQVQFLGELDDDGLVQAYQQCDLFALPNREVNGDFEGFGMVLLEAQSCGKPVLAGDSGGTAETMQRGKTGVIVDCTQPAPLAEAVCDLLTDENRRIQMGTAAREWAVGEFDWNALAAKAAAIFGEVGGKRKAASSDRVTVGASVH